MDQIEELIDYIDRKDEDVQYSIDHRYINGYRSALRHIRNKLVTIALGPKKGETGL